MFSKVNGPSLLSPKSREKWVVSINTDLPTNKYVPLITLGAWRRAGMKGPILRLPCIAIQRAVGEEIQLSATLRRVSSSPSQGREGQRRHQGSPQNEL